MAKAGVKPRLPALEADALTLSLPRPPALEADALTLSLPRPPALEAEALTTGPVKQSCEVGQFGTSMKCVMPVSAHCPSIMTAAT